MRFYSNVYKKEQQIGIKKKWFAWYPVVLNNTKEPSVCWLEIILREYDPIGKTKYWYYSIEDNNE